MATPDNPEKLEASQLAPEHTLESTKQSEIAIGDRSNPGLAQESENVDEDLSTDQDSAIGDLGSYVTSTYTVGSSGKERVEENGRSYHVYKDGKYMLPNDEKELNRLDIQHKMWTITLDEKLHLAPIGSAPQNVLDIATGTGIWAIDFADAYPSANVLGTDLSSIQPLYVPPNCRFEIDDAEDEWIFSTKFDYIHARAVTTCFKDTPNIISKAYDALLPGGYLEFQDCELQKCDDSSFSGTALSEWQTHLQEATKKTGRTWGENVPMYKTWMIEKGFEDVTEVLYRWPSNQWPENQKEKLLGAWFQAQVDAGILESASTRIFTSYLGWSSERLTVFLAMLRQEIKDPNIKAYIPVHIVYGRKPSTA